jgi:hypothetical protein
LSDVPDDFGKKAILKTDASHSRKSNKPPKQVKHEAIRGRLKRELSANPRFSEAPRSGQAFVIGGLAPSTEKALVLETLEYEVFVDDNFHFMNEVERYKRGDFQTLEEAVRKCQIIVDDFLTDQYKPGMSADQLFNQYTCFGEDPFISGQKSDFSAWDYARQRCNELCQPHPGENGPTDS